jgi:uncharacterized UPF0146 family protein
MFRFIVEKENSIFALSRGLRFSYNCERKGISDKTTNPNISINSGREKIYSPKPCTKLA